MFKDKMITGSLVALVTPMKADNSLDWQQLATLIEYQIANSTNGIVVLGTTGEAATLTLDEKIQLIKRSLDIVNNRVPVIAGTGTNSTATTIELTEIAKQSGVDACLLVTPYYNKPTQKGLILHHQAIAKAVAIPQILYNVPSRTAVDMKAETICQLAKQNNIAGIKEAAYDLNKLQYVLQHSKENFALYSGDDETAMEYMLHGGAGVISVVANVAPKLVSQLCSFAIQKDRLQAEKINKRLTSLYEALFIETNPIPVKHALKQQKLIGSGIRLPLTELSKSHEKLVFDAVEQATTLP